MTNINLFEEAIFLSGKTNCTLEEAMIYVRAQDEYYDSIGLNFYPDENGFYEIDGKKYSWDMLNSLPLPKNVPVVDNEKMLSHISEGTGLSLAKCHELEAAEFDYLEKTEVID